MSKQTGKSTKTLVTSCHNCGYIFKTMCERNRKIARKLHDKKGCEVNEDAEETIRDMAKNVNHQLSMVYNVKVLANDGSMLMTTARGARKN